MVHGFAFLAFLCNLMFPSVFHIYDYFYCDRLFPDMIEHELFLLDDVDICFLLVVQCLDSFHTFIVPKWFGSF